MAKKKMKIADWIAIWWLIVGGLNWGLVGLFKFDLVAQIFPESATRWVYSLVGIAAAYSIYSVNKLKKK